MRTAKPQTEVYAKASILLTADDRLLLTVHAQKAGVDRSAFVRTLLREHCREHWVSSRRRSGPADDAGQVEAVDQDDCPMVEVSAA